MSHRIRLFTWNLEMLLRYAQGVLLAGAILALVPFALAYGAAQRVRIGYAGSALIGDRWLPLMLALNAVVYAAAICVYRLVG